jgi:hypothetical protein
MHHIVCQKFSHTSEFDDSIYIPFRGSGYECITSQTHGVLDLPKRCTYSQLRKVCPVKLVKAQSEKAQSAQVSAILYYSVQRGAIIRNSV